MQAMTTPPHQAPLTDDQAEAWRQSLRSDGDGLDHGFVKPSAVEPLASRLERASRVADCHTMTRDMLTRWVDGGASASVFGGVWVQGVRIDFLVLTWKGVFCVWSFDHRWTDRQAAFVQPARAQIQAELLDFPGKVETFFHSPREPTGWTRHIRVHPETDEPFEVVTAGGDIAHVLATWQPVAGVGLDPEWIVWLDHAATPRWWRSAEGRRPEPDMPPEERG